jgi:hypothetical protein
MPSLFTDGGHNEDDAKTGPDKPTPHKTGPAKEKSGTHEKA